MNRTARVLILLGAAALLTLVLAAGVLFLVSGGRPVDFIQKTLLSISLSSRQDDLNRPFSEDTTPLRFTINPGDTPRVIAQALVEASLIRDGQLFVDYVRLNDLDRQLEAGTYFLSRSQSLAQIAVALTDSRSSQFPFRILEGWRLEEVLAIIDTSPYFGFTGAEFIAVAGPGSVQDAAFAQAVGLPEGASLEGFLFPDTYQLPAVVTPTMLRDFLLTAFLERTGPQLAQDAAQQGLSLFQVVILASIVQRESVHVDEQPLIASVYRNRFTAGQRLEADPTVQYALGFRGDTWWPRITVDDYYSAASPYNTYLSDGLPPGPIANPGLSAIQAVVYPAQTNYFYMRADCRADGYHDFATTYDEHLANGC